MNKLSKLIYLTSLMSLCALSAASCSTKQADIDISSLSSEFNESGIFSETLSDISQPIMEKRYGIEEGQKELLKERKKIAKKLLNLGLDIKQIQEITQLTINEIEELKNN